MNRDIRFRAWDGYKMHYDLFDITFGINPYSQNKCITFNAGNSYISSEYYMQYSGLIKNDKEIYEGDILKHSLGYIFIVEYSIESCSFCLKSPGRKTTHTLLGTRTIEFIDEVLGNIYENSELIGG